MALRGLPGSRKAKGAQLQSAIEHDRIYGMLSSQSGGVTGAESFHGSFTPTTSQTPFLVTRDPDNANKVIVGTDRAHARYGYEDWILGDLELQKTTAETLTITTAGVVYYDISTNPNTASATLKNAATLPATGTCVLLAHVGFASSKITTLTQVQWGNIMVRQPRWADLMYYTAVNATSTSTIALTADPQLDKYVPIRWRTGHGGGPWTYGIIMATTASLLTIGGPAFPLATNIGQIQYGRPELVTQFDIILPGKYTLSGAIQPPIYWRAPGYAYMVHCGAIAQRGTAVVNVDIGSAGSVLSTGMTMTGSWVNCGNVVIHSSRYSTQVDEAIELTFTSTDADDEDLSCSLTFVSA